MVIGNSNVVGLWRIRWFRGLFALDLLGLLAAAYLAAQPLQFPKSNMLVTLSVTLGLTFWFAFQPRIALPPQNRYLRALVIPVLTASATLIALATLRDFYSGVYLAKFTLGWFMTMLLVRGLMALVRPPDRVLLAGPSHFWAEMPRSRRIEMVTAQRPPESVADWDIVVLDPTLTYDAGWLSWLAHADVRGTPIASAPSWVESLTGKVALEVLEGAGATQAFSGSSDYRGWKRFFDVVATLSLVPVVIPLGVLAAVLIALDSGRPVLFWQTRMGKDGRPFRMVKFRTMRLDAEVNGEAFAGEGDHRITRVGSVLRRLRLDELPQFWNVLIGNMSIVGPRPEQEPFAKAYERLIPLYGVRHTVKPGITGWAQVNQGYTSNTEEAQEKLRYDIYYVKHLSFWLDSQIVVRTFRIILTGLGAR